MEYPNFGYYWNPEDEHWNRMLQEVPRANLEKILFDYSISSGVLTGLELLQNTVPSLNVRVTAGRGVFRDETLKLGRHLENRAVVTLDVSTYVPLVGTQDIYIVARPSYNVSPEAFILVDAEPALLSGGGQNPDFDPAFTPYNLHWIQRDEVSLVVTPTPTTNDCRIGVVRMYAGMGAVTVADIQTTENTQRTYAVAAIQIEALKVEINAVKATVAGHTADLAAKQLSINALNDAVTAIEAENLDQAASISDHESRLDDLEAGDGSYFEFHVYRALGATTYLRADRDINLTGFAGKKMLFTLGALSVVCIDDSGKSGYSPVVSAAVILGDAVGATTSGQFSSANNIGQTFAAVGGSPSAPNYTLIGTQASNSSEEVNANDSVRTFGGAFVIDVPSGTTSKRLWLAILSDNARPENVPINVKSTWRMVAQDFNPYAPTGAPDQGFTNVIGGVY
jgi:hypothetical protein